MARVYFGGIVSKVLGTVTGVCFGKNATTWFVRRPPRPPQSYFPLRFAQDRRLAFLAAIWRTFSKATRDDWHDYGQTVTLFDYWGDSYHPTGQQAFLRLNLVYADPWTDNRSARPTLDGLPAGHTLTIDYNAAALRLTAIAAPLLADEDLWISVFAPRTSANATRTTPILSRHRVTSATGLPYTLQASYASPFTAGTLLAAVISSVLIDADYRSSNAWQTQLELTAA